MTAVHCWQSVREQSAPPSYPASVQDCSRTPTGGWGLGFFDGLAAEDGEGLELGGGEDFPHLVGLLDPVVAEEFDAAGVLECSVFEGAVGLGDELETANADGFDLGGLTAGKGELLLNLRRDEHAVAEDLVLNLVEAGELVRLEEGKGFGVVAVDEGEEALVRGEPRGMLRFGIFGEGCGFGFEIAAEDAEFRALRGIKAEIGPHAGGVHEDSNGARVVGGAGGGVEAGGSCDGEGNREDC